MRRLHRLHALLLLGLVLSLLGGCGTPESRKARYMAKGRAFLEQNNLDKARVEFRNALQVMPNDGEVRYENGLVAEKLNNQRDALSFYQGAIDVKADYVDARYRLARLYLMLGGYTQALDILKPGLDAHPEEPKFLSIRAAARGHMNDSAGALEDAEHAYRLAPTSEDTIAVVAGIYAAQHREEDAWRVLKAGIAALPASVDLRMALVQSYLTTNHPAEAESTLKELVHLQPDHSEYSLRLAAFYAANKRTPEAESTLRAAILANPKQVQLKLALVQLIAVTKSPEAAETELLAQVAENPQLMDLRFALARRYAESNQAPKAEATLNEIIKAEGTSATGLAAKNALAMVKLRSGDMAAGEALVAEVLRDSPRDVQALNMRGDLELQRGDAKSAVADLRAVLRDQPNLVTALRSLAKAHVANGEGQQAEEVLRRAVDANPNDTSLAMDLVDLLVQTGKPDQARTLAEALIKRLPNEPAVYEALVRVQLIQKDLAAADATATVVRQKFADLPLGYFLGGLIAETQQKPALALSQYSTGVDKNPAADEVINAYARVALAEKKIPELKAKLEKLTVEHPDYVQPWQLLAEVNLGTRQLPQAEQGFNKAIELAPRRLAGYRGLALTKMATGDKDGAIAALKLATTKVTQSDQAGMELAIAYQQMGRTVESINTYEVLLKTNPRNEAAANNLAMMLVDRADKVSLDRAKALSEPFAKANNLRFVDTYGWVLIARGEYAKAISVLQPIVDKVPNAAVVRYHLAMAQVKTGDVAGGRANLEAALKSGDGFEGAAAAKTLLASLK